MYIAIGPQFIVVSCVLYYLANLLDERLVEYTFRAIFGVDMDKITDKQLTTNVDDVNPLKAFIFPSIVRAVLVTSVKGVAVVTCLFNVAILIADFVGG